jgi:Fe-S cluster assembly protein SufD
MDDFGFDAIAARERLAAHGWVSRRTESFRHLTPPDAGIWLGEGVVAAVDRAAGRGWTLRPVGGSASGVVEAHTLDAGDREQRAQLLAGVPPLDAGDAAPFAWAHRALLREGLRVRIAAASGGAVPCLELRFDPTAQVEAPLLVVELMPGARCVLVESHDRQAEGASFAGSARGVVQNLQVHVVLGAAAGLTHLRVVRPRAADRIAHDVQVHAAADARYAAAVLAAGSHYHLQRVLLALDGEGAAAAMGTVLLAHGTAIDQQVRARHDARATTTTVDTLGLAREAARLVVNAHTRIGADCSKADARQRLAAIPTAGNPKVTLRPHLEIHHDDVQAAHGATFGALPEDALFHARQRGLDERTAQALIVGGLARATLSRALPDPGLLEAHGLGALVDDTVAAHLSARDSKTEARHG